MRSTPRTLSLVSPLIILFMLMEPPLVRAATMMPLIFDDAQGRLYEVGNDDDLNPDTPFLKYGTGSLFEGGHQTVVYDTSEGAMECHLGIDCPKSVYTYKIQLATGHHPDEVKDPVPKPPALFNRQNPVLKYGTASLFEGGHQTVVYDTDEGSKECHLGIDCPKSVYTYKIQLATGHHPDEVRASGTAPTPSTKRRGRRVLAR